MPAPAPAFAEQFVSRDGGRHLIEWFEPPWMPPRDECAQAFGMCFVADGRIVLVLDPGGWNMPGGRIERDETCEQAFVREVAEEACARVVEAEYVGAQRVTELPDGVPRYQVRFWARVELDDWRPKFETTDRQLVWPDDFRTTLWWGETKTARVLLEHGLRIEAERSGAR